MSQAVEPLKDYKQNRRQGEGMGPTDSMEEAWIPCWPGIHSPGIRARKETARSPPMTQSNPHGAQRQPNRGGEGADLGKEIKAFCILHRERIF